MHWTYIAFPSPHYWNERNFKTSLYIYNEVQWCSLQDKRLCLKCSTDFVLQIFNKGKLISEVLKTGTMNILVYWVKILYRLVDWHNWRYWRKHGFSTRIAVKAVTLQRISHNVNPQSQHYHYHHRRRRRRRRHHRHHHHHHHHHHTAWRIIGLVTHSGPNNSLEVFLRIALGFVSPHSWYFMIKCSSLSVHSQNMYTFIPVVLNFLYNWNNFNS